MCYKKCKKRVCMAPADKGLNIHSATPMLSRHHIGFHALSLPDVCSENKLKIKRQQYQRTSTIPHRSVATVTIYTFTVITSKRVMTPSIRITGMRPVCALIYVCK